MEAVSLNATLRNNYGKGANKQLRKEGRIPGIVCSTDETVHITLNPKDLKPLVYTPKFRVANINLDGKDYKCIVKDVQFHPQTDEILHIDFLTLEDGRVVKVNIPIQLTGQASGVKTGGKLYQKVRKAKIKAASENLIDKLELDVTKLELGQSIRIRDIVSIDGIQIMNAPGTPVASVEIPRALRSAKDAAAAAGVEEDEEGEEGEGEEGAGEE